MLCSNNLKSLKKTIVGVVSLNYHLGVVQFRGLIVTQLQISYMVDLNNNKKMSPTPPPASSQPHHNCKIYRPYREYINKYIGIRIVFALGLGITATSCLFIFYYNLSHIIKVIIKA